MFGLCGDSPHCLLWPDPQGGSVDECWRRKLAEHERTFSEDISSKMKRIHQLEETLKSKQESCSPDQSELTGSTSTCK